MQATERSWALLAGLRLWLAVCLRVPASPDGRLQQGAWVLALVGEQPRLLLPPLVAVAVAVQWQRNGEAQAQAWAAWRVPRPCAGSRRRRHGGEVPRGQPQRCVLTGVLLSVACGPVLQLRRQLGRCRAQSCRPPARNNPSWAPP